MPSFWKRVGRGWVLVSGSLAGMAAAAEPVRVIDGDTISVGTATYRLYGIDAPEAGQTCRNPAGTWPCGRVAISQMESLVLGRTVSCDNRGHDDYGRILGVCIADGVEINQRMVETGFAWAFRRYADTYNAVEDAANRAGVGVWQFPTQTPWEYREARWTIASSVAPEGCPIKGNINREGDRIYHAPWSPWYDRTSINDEAGERWFCDESEAVSAGWRAPYWGR